MFHVILIIILFLVTSDLSISFQPFKFSFGDLYKGFGMVFLITSILLFTVSSSQKSYNEGYVNGAEDVRDLIIKELESKQTKWQAK